jgi:hypothetical protein
MFKCPDCLYLTDRRYNLNGHIKRKHQTRQKQAKISSVENIEDIVENVEDIVENVDEIFNKNNTNAENVDEIAPKISENPENFPEKNGKIAKNPPLECQNCKKQYKTKRYYDNHIKTCQVFIDNKYQCPYCKKQLSSTSSKSHHLKICPTKESQLIIQNHQSSITPSITTTTTTTTTTTNSNNKQTIINNYTINNIKRSTRKSRIDYESSDDEDYDIDKINDFGKENTDYISQETLDILTDHIDIQQLIKLKHFNPEHPENHNIRHNTTSAKSVKVLKDNQWQVHPKNDIFNQIFKKSKNQLFNISLDHRLTNRHNLTDQEIEELSERWLNYDKYSLKKAMDFITIQFEELIKQKNKSKQLVTSQQTNHV